MSKISISKTKDYFEKDGKPFFYLADTLWNSFSNTSLKEWDEYLDYRKQQGFNVVTISVLGIWNDRSSDPSQILPYALKENGKFDFYKRNEEYFIKARKMCEMAVHKGFVPALVVLWMSYVPETQSVPSDPEWQMPYALVKDYTEYVVKTFSEYDPIYIISGDTNFGPEIISRYYLTILETVKKMQPDSLTAMHIAGNMPDLPDEFTDSGYLDFYLYQSSHGLEEQHNAYNYAQNFYKKPAKRPVMNGEPCYEGIPYMDKGVWSGRYNETQVRRALWQSLLSGAKAGFTYGGHGLWMWHKDTSAYFSEGWSGRPFNWDVAMRFKGAWDAAYAKELFEMFNLFDIEPVDHIINRNMKDIRMSASGDMSKILIYVPFSTDVKTDLDMEEYEWTMINLSTKEFVKPVIEAKPEGSMFRMYPFNSDVLLIGRK